MFQHRIVEYFAIRVSSRNVRFDFICPVHFYRCEINNLIYSMCLGARSPVGQCNICLYEKKKRICPSICPTVGLCLSCPSVCRSSQKVTFHRRRFLKFPTHVAFALLFPVSNTEFIQFDRVFSFRLVSYRHQKPKPN